MAVVVNDAPSRDCAVMMVRSSRERARAGHTQRLDTVEADSHNQRLVWAWTGEVAHVNR